MDKGFIDVIQLMVKEQGKEVLVNGRAQKFLTDYCRGQFKKEAAVFRQILDAKCGEHINNADNVPERKLQLAARLEDDNALSPKATVDYLDLLGLILKGDTSRIAKTSEEQKAEVEARLNAGIGAKAQPQSAPANGTSTVISSSGYEMVFVPGGSFQMGDTVGNGSDYERPVHTVTLSAFYMGKYVVTQKEWYDVMGTTIRQQRDMVGKSEQLYGEGDNYPMYYVSWHEAVEYCNKRSVKEGLTPVYRGSGNNITCDWKANGYRLPTEAEWEYAAKGGNKDPMVYEYSGSNSAEAVAWYDGNGGEGAKPVGTKAPNSLGLYDMSGNVWEWCWDWYGNYSSGLQTDPQGASSGSYRVPRGGGWGDSAAYVRSAYRGNGTPSDRVYDLGFRLVRP